MDRRSLLFVALVAVFGLLVMPAASSAAEVSGTVKNVNAAEQKAVVTADGKDVTIKWDDKIEILVDGKKGAAADVKVGAKVKVTHTEGKASKIEVSK